MSDFSDRPFVAGSLIGLRSFGVDKLGRLHGPTYDSVFRPGVNVAECRKGEGDFFARGGFIPSGTSRWYLHYDPLPLFVPSPPPTPKPTRAERWHLPLRPGGYRAGGPIVDEVIDDVELEVAEEVSTPIEPPHTLAGADCVCGFYAYFDGGNDYKKPERVTALIEGTGVCTVGDRGFRAEKARLVALVAPGKKFPAGRFQLVLRNYPDVPVYATRSAAVGAYPLTPPDAPGPESDGFWDKPVRA